MLVERKKRRRERWRRLETGMWRGGGTIVGGREKGERRIPKKFPNSF